MDVAQTPDGLLCELEINIRTIQNNILIAQSVHLYKAVFLHHERIEKVNQV